MYFKKVKLILPDRLATKLNSWHEDYLNQTNNPTLEGFIQFLEELESLDEHLIAQLKSHQIIENSHFGKEDELPQIISHKRHFYSLIGQVGKGAMGEILLIQDEDLQRQVAYKKIRKSILKDPKILRRFLSEVKITAQLEHPNIVPVYSLEITDDGQIAYSMKLIQGKTLKKTLSEKLRQLEQKQVPPQSLGLPTLLEHFLKVCDAIHYAHMKGVIHRDLKPANIMISPFHEIYVMDWGIARLIDDLSEETFDSVVTLDSHDLQSDNATQFGEIVGTPRYMSPEQALSKHNELTGKSDQFSLGLILYEIVTLRPAFEAKDPMEMIKKAIRADISEIESDYENKIAPELKAIIKKATQRQEKNRYKNVAFFADDIRRFLRGDEVLASPDSTVKKLFRFMNRHRFATLSIMLSLLLLAATGVIWGLYHSQQTLITSQKHEKNMSQFLSAVANKSQTIDRQFLKFERLLEGLSAAMIHSLKQPVPEKQVLFLNEILNTNKLKDFKFSKIYNRKISINWAAYVLSPDVEKEDIQSTLNKLSHFSQYFKQVMLKSYDDKALNYSSKEQYDLIYNKGVPLIWAFIGLENGLHLTYPGKTGFAAGYDPRKRPWYTQSKQSNSIQWLSPYIDASGNGLMLPCTLPLYDNNQKLIGVAGVEMAMSFIIKNLMSISMPGIISTYLVNDMGDIVIRSTDKIDRYKTNIVVNTVPELEKFAYSDILTAIKNKESGYTTTFEFNQNQLFAYYPIQSLGWYFIVEANEQQLIDFLSSKANSKVLEDS